jgi:hypothetical protein
MSGSTTVSEELTFIADQPFFPAHSDISSKTITIYGLEESEIKIFASDLVDSKYGKTPDKIGG